LEKASALIAQMVCDCAVECARFGGGPRACENGPRSKAVVCESGPRGKAVACENSRVVRNSKAVCAAVRGCEMPVESIRENGIKRSSTEDRDVHERDIKSDANLINRRDAKKYRMKSLMQIALLLINLEIRSIASLPDREDCLNGGLFGVSLFS
jgi:hypothetical protein